MAKFDSNTPKPLNRSSPKFAQVINVGDTCGLRRFQYMTVSVQRGGHFRYMTTSVHMRSISVHVFFAVRLRYMRSTISVHNYVDIGTVHCKRTSIFMLTVEKNAKWMLSVSTLCCYASCVQLNVVVHARHQSLATGDRSESELSSTNTSPLTSRC